MYCYVNLFHEINFIIIIIKAVTFAYFCPNALIFYWLRIWWLWFFSRRNLNKISMKYIIVSEVNKNRRIRTKDMLCHSPYYYYYLLPLLSLGSWNKLYYYYHYLLPLLSLGSWNKLYYYYHYLLPLLSLGSWNKLYYYYYYLLPLLSLRPSKLFLNSFKAMLLVFWTRL